MDPGRTFARCERGGQRRARARRHRGRHSASRGEHGVHLAEHRRRRRSFACHWCGIVVKCPDAGVAALDTRSDQSDRGGAVHVVWSACGGPREVGCEEQRSGPPADAFQILEPEALKIHIDHTTACTPARRCYWVLSCPRGLGWYYERACWRLAALPTASCHFVRLFLCVHAGWRVGCCRGPPRPGGCPAAQCGDCNETARWIQLTTDVVDAF